MFVGGSDVAFMAMASANWPSGLDPKEPVVIYRSADRFTLAADVNDRAERHVGKQSPRELG